jgi:hypothetical protein
MILMSDSKQKEMLFTRVIKPKLEKELETLGDSFKKIVEDYAWLFDNDLGKSKDVFLELYLDQLDVTTNQIKLEYNSFYNKVSEKIKQEIYQKAMDKFISSLTIDELQDDSANKSVQAEELEEEQEPVNETKTEDDSDQFPM